MSHDIKHDPVQARLHEINRVFAARETELLERLNVALADLRQREQQCERLTQEAAELRDALNNQTAQREAESVVDVAADERAKWQLEATELQRANLALQREAASAQAALLEARERSGEAARRAAAEHAAQLLGLQQRASNDRDTLSLAHLQGLRSLQQEATLAREGLEFNYRSMLDALRRDNEALRAQHEANQAHAELRERELLEESRALAAALEATRTQGVRDLKSLETQLAVERLRRVELDAALAASRSQLLEVQKATAALGSKFAHEATTRSAAELRSALLSAELAQAREALTALLEQLGRLEEQGENRLLHEREARTSLEHRLQASEATVLRMAAGGATWPSGDAGPSGARSGGLLQRGNAADSLEQLLALNGESFVDAAYRTLLQRAPDAPGLANYTARLREGVSKVELLLAMAESEEGRRVGCQLDGLSKLLGQARSSTPGWLGRLFSWAERDARKAPDRQALRLENQLGILADDLAGRSAQISWLSGQGHGLREQLETAVKRLATMEADLWDLRPMADSSRDRDERLSRIEQQLAQLASNGPALQQALQEVRHAAAGIGMLEMVAPPPPPADDEPTVAAFTLPGIAAVERARLLLQRPPGHRA